MRIVSAAVLWVLVAVHVGSAHGEQKPRAPLLVLMERNPWLHVIGSDSPSFALYDDGLVIFQRQNQNRRAELASVVLDAAEKDRFLATVPTAEQRASWKDYYRLTSWKDQPSNRVYLWSQNKPSAVGLYGSLRNPKDGDGGPGLDSPPAELAALLTALLTFHHARAKTWTPETVEILAQPVDGDPKKAMDWPHDLPGLEHPTTVHRGPIYSIYIAYPRFVDLNKRVREKGGNPSFGISGKTCAVDFRWPFPGEAAWMRSSN